MPETKQQKAERYLREGRLTVILAGGNGRFPIHAVVKGQEAEYDLGFDRVANEWRCTCEANATFHRRCCHLIALQLVTRRPTANERSGRE